MDHLNSYSPGRKKDFKGNYFFSKELANAIMNRSCLGNKFLLRLIMTIKLYKKRAKVLYITSQELRKELLRENKCK